MMIPLLLLAQAVQGAPVPTPPAPTPPPPPGTAKIILVGDSTMQNRTGWGGSFCAKHVAPPTACVNMSRGGRSSGSYRREGLWDGVKAEIAKPGYAKVYVLVQFGHNDKPGVPGRSTDLVTEFPVNMRGYVTEARDVGAVPVLVTPLTRRDFRDGKLYNDLLPWAEATQRVATETGTPLLPLNAESAVAVDAMGSAAADRLGPPLATAPAPTPAATAVPPSPAKPPKLDRTHLGAAGSDYFAAMVTRELGVAVPALRPLLR